MSTALHHLFSALVDDAALFPPAQTPMAVAVSAHAGHRTAWYAYLVGPFLCPASRLSELTAVLDTDSRRETVEVSVIADTGTSALPQALGALAADRRTAVRGVELAVRDEPLGDAVARALADLEAALPTVAPPASEGHAGVAVSVELPPTAAGRAALAAVAACGHQAKLRTGGPSATAFPPEQDVAEFLLACHHLDVPLKCTAGLHQAVRHTERSTGLERHGYLNLLLAASAATDGGGVADVGAVLAVRDAAGLAARARALSTEEAVRIRRLVRSFGSCSVSEPVEDLRTLGLLTEE